MILSRFSGPVLGALLLLAAAAPAADFAVDDPSDAPDAAPGDGICASAAGPCTLRAAVQEANALAGADAISLPGGTFVLDLAGDREDAAATGDLDLGGELAIRGRGPLATRIDGAGLDRIFQVSVGAVVTLSDLGVRNGWRPEDEQGGGIYNDGDLSLVRVHVTDNEAWLSGGIANFGTLWLQRSEVRDNVSSTLANVLGGGGIGNAGTVFVDDSTISGNTTQGTGGGIGSVGDVEVLRSTVSGNHAARNGGGIVTAGGTLSLVNSTLSGNTTNESGGGVATLGVPLFADNATLTANIADVDGDGAGDGGGLRSTGPTVLRNTILADNSDLGGEAPDCAGGIVSEGYNLFGDTTGCSVGGGGSTDVSGISAGLGPLGHHGGPTRTHRPVPGSPAIDTGSPGISAPCEIEDQRRLARPEDGDGDGTPRCDIGAVELPEPKPLLARVAGALVLVALARRRRRRAAPLPGPLREDGRSAVLRPRSIGARPALLSSHPSHGAHAIRAEDRPGARRRRNVASSRAPTASAAPAPGSGSGMNRGSPGSSAKMS